MTCPRPPYQSTAEAGMEPRPGAADCSSLAVVFRVRPGLRGGGGVLIPALRMVVRTQYTRLARGLALSRCQGADPYDGKGMKLGHLLVDEEAREDPLKGQRVPTEGNPVGVPRGVLRCQREEAPPSGG